jgi:hypothetical protein
LTPAALSVSVVGVLLPQYGQSNPGAAVVVVVVVVDEVVVEVVVVVGLLKICGTRSPLAVIPTCGHGVCGCRFQSRWMSTWCCWSVRSTWCSRATGSGLRIAGNICLSYLSEIGISAWPV